MLLRTAGENIQAVTDPEGEKIFQRLLRKQAFNERLASGFFWFTNAFFALSIVYLATALVIGTLGKVGWISFYLPILVCTAFEAFLVAIYRSTRRSTVWLLRFLDTCKQEGSDPPVLALFQEMSKAGAPRKLVKLLKRELGDYTFSRDLIAYTRLGPGFSCGILSQLPAVQTFDDYLFYLRRALSLTCKAQPSVPLQAGRSVTSMEERSVYGPLNEFVQVLVSAPNHKEAIGTHLIELNLADVNLQNMDVLHRYPYDLEQVSNTAALMRDDKMVAAPFLLNRLRKQWSQVHTAVITEAVYLWRTTGEISVDSHVLLSLLYRLLYLFNCCPWRWHARVKEQDFLLPDGRTIRLRLDFQPGRHLRVERVA